jgi:hypothetical protein
MCVCALRSGYVIVAWVWSAIWYVMLDPIKWALAWVLNEDGFRDQVSATRCCSCRCVVKQAFSQASQWAASANVTRCAVLCADRCTARILADDPV